MLYMYSIERWLAMNVVEQAALRRRGYDIGCDPDGQVGTKSKAAIADFQQQAGLEVNGRFSVRVLAALKR
jgi:peptidoglycan hydrolase-like protein with peptidoglycan-binding domain